MNPIAQTPNLDQYPLPVPLHKVEVTHTKVALHLIDAKAEKTSGKNMTLALGHFLKRNVASRQRPL